MKTLYTLLFFSGMASLVYEVIWMRSFSLIFGSTSRAASAVLGAFFMGLAIGNVIGARFADSRSVALLRYGIAEFAIGAGALLVAVWIGLFSHVYPGIYALGGASLTLSKLLLAFIAMGIPCAAMGATLPLITRAIVDWPGHLGRRVGIAYALNTLGATVGVLLAGFVLPPTIGTKNSVFLAVAINVAVGVTAIVIARCRRAVTDRSSSPGDISAGPMNVTGDDDVDISRTPQRADPVVLFIVIVSGFGTLALEVLYTRLIVNITDTSVMSFALMLSAFLVFLALASFVVSWTVDRVRSPWRLLAWTQSLAVVVILVSPSFFDLSSGIARDSLWHYLVGLLMQLLVVMGPTILLLGMALPIAWKIATRSAAESGFRVGRLTGLNTLGAVVGSLAAGFFILPVIGIKHGFALIAGLYGCVGLLCWFKGYGRSGAVKGGVAIVIAFTVLTALGTMNPYMLVLREGEQKVSIIEGESVTVAVVENTHGDRFLKVNNGYTLGASDETTVAVQRNLGGLPLLLHADPKSIAFIGVATGVSVSAISLFAVERVLAMELLAEVLQAAPYFDHVNGGVLNDPRVETLKVDGRNHLFATQEKFDVIVGDLFVVWHAGTGDLYTREHFAAVADRLRDDGTFVQWLPAREITIKDMRMIVATFVDVFPSAELWLNRPDPRLVGTLALTAYAGTGPAPGERTAAEQSQDFRGLTFVCDSQILKAWSAGALLNSDEFPRIEFSAALTVFHPPEQRESDMRKLISELRQTYAGAD